MTHSSMTCAEFQALLPDYLDGAAAPLAAAERAAADAHLARCVECSALVAELRAIVRDAAALPPLVPERDLWSGIASRIEAPVVALAPRGAPAAAAMQQGGPQGVQHAPTQHAPARHAWRRLAVAASLLVAVTAGVTYAVVKREGTRQLASAGDSSFVDVLAPAGSAQAQPVALQATEQTFDREIGAMRKIVDERRKDLDPATVAVLEKNLKIIDAAIAESKAALASDPASAFLMDRLTHAYDDKLQLLRGVASIPSHG